MIRTVLPYTRAEAESAAEATARLREEEPPLGLDLAEAICPTCRFAFWISNRLDTFGLCSECRADRLVRVEA